MIIESLKLRNIRSYIEQEIKFPLGTTLLSGDIGSGKSTILLAIEFALFGTKRGDLSGSSLLRHGKKEGFVELNFLVSGKKTVIRRALKRSKDQILQDSGFIIIEGKKTEATPIELKTKILGLIGYPPDLASKSKDLIYRYTVYTPQEQMKQILFESEDVRVEVLRKIFGIDKYRRIRDNISIALKDFREKKKEIEGKTSDIQSKKKTMNEKKSEISDIDARITKLSLNLNEIADKIRKEKEKLSEKEKEVKQLQELNRKIEICGIKIREKTIQSSKEKKEGQDLSLEIKKLEGRISVLGAEDTIDSIENEIRMLEKEVKENEIRKNLISGAISHSEENIKLIEKDIAELEKTILGMEDKENELHELKAKTSERKNLEAHISKTRNEVAELSSLVKEMEVLKRQSEEIRERVAQLEKCPVCAQDVSEHHKKHVHERELKNILEFGDKLKRILLEKEKKENELRENEKKLSEINECEKIIERLNAEILHKEKTRDSLLKKKKDVEEFAKKRITHLEEMEQLSKYELENERSVLEEKKNTLKKLIERDNLLRVLEEKKSRQDSLEKIILALDGEISGLSEELEKINVEKTSLAKVEEEYIELSAVLEKSASLEIELSLKKAANEKEREILSRMTAELCLEIEEKEKLVERLSRISQLEILFEEQIYSLSFVIEKQMMSRIYFEFNELFQKWFGTLTDDALLNVGLDENFNPLIEQNGYAAEIENLSGGEKTSLALAYRLALNQVINNVLSGIKTKDIIILDEPTDGFSSEQIDKLRNVLDELKMNQVIIVSHESKIESFVSNVITISKSEHISTVER